MEIILACWLVLTLFKPKQKTVSAPTISNEVIQHIIMQILSEADKPLTVTEIQCSSEHLYNIPNRRICYVLNILIREQKSVEKTVDKHVMYFKLKI